MATGATMSDAKVAWLQQVLDVNVMPRKAAQPEMSAVPQAKVVTFTKARTAWLATRNKVEGDLGALQTKLLASFKGHSKIDDLEQSFRTRVETVLTSLDDQLAHALDEACKVTDPAQHAERVVAARKIIQRYESYVASDETIAALDKNPLVPLAIQKTFITTLSVLSKSVV